MQSSQKRASAGNADRRSARPTHPATCGAPSLSSTDKSSSCVSAQSAACARLDCRLAHPLAPAMAAEASTK